MGGNVQRDLGSESLELSVGTGTGKRQVQFLCTCYVL